MAKWKLGVNRRLLKSFVGVSVIWLLVMGGGWIASNTIWAPDPSFCKKHFMDIDIAACQDAVRMMETKRPELQRIGIAVLILPPSIFLLLIFLWNLRRHP